MLNKGTSFVIQLIIFSKRLWQSLLQLLTLFKFIYPLSALQSVSPKLPSFKQFLGTLTSVIFLFLNSGCHSDGNLDETTKENQTTPDGSGNFNLYQVGVNQNVSVAQTDLKDSGQTFTYSLFSGTGSVDQNGLYQASGSPGLNLVKAVSSSGEVRYLTVYVSAGFLVLPSVTEVVVNQNKQFIIQGGSGLSSNYNWTVNVGTVTTEGSYKAASTPGADTVTVSEVSGSTGTAAVTVKPELSISPAATTMSVGESLTLTTTGGVGSIKLQLLSGEGELNSATGVYIAPTSPGMAVIKAQDEERNFVLSFITVNNSLTINPKTVSVLKGSTYQFSAMGGKAPLATRYQALVMVL